MSNTASEAKYEQVLHTQPPCRAPALPPKPMLMLVCSLCVSVGPSAMQLHALGVAQVIRVSLTSTTNKRNPQNQPNLKSETRAHKNRGMSVNDGALDHSLSPSLDHTSLTLASDDSTTNAAVPHTLRFPQQLRHSIQTQSALSHSLLHSSHYSRRPEEGACHATPVNTCIVSTAHNMLGQCTCECLSGNDQRAYRLQKTGVTTWLARRPGCTHRHP